MDTVVGGPVGASPAPASSTTPGSTPIETQADEAKVSLTRSELEATVSSLQWATGKGVWMVEDLEMMGKLQIRLRYLLNNMPPRSASASK